MRISMIRTLLAVIVLLGGMSGRAGAQSLDLDEIKPLPSYDKELSQKDFLDRTQLVEEMPRGDKFLGFKARLPKSWKRIGERIDDSDGEGSQQGDVKLSRRILGKIVKYYGTEVFTAPSRFEIQALELDQQITARNWFLGYILSNGYNMQGMKVYDDTKVEALYVTIEDSVSYVVRTLAIVNGPRMVLVSYYVPEAQFMQDRGLQEKVVQSFSFLSPEKIQLEPTQTYSFLELVHFDFPANWRLLSPNIHSLQNMDARLIRLEGEKSIIGDINIKIISTELETSLSQEVNFLKSDIREMGLEIGDLIETPTAYTFKPHITFARVEVYNIKPKDDTIQDHEYWLAVMAEDRYYYIVSMITPARMADFYKWAQNTEAFQTVIESMRP